jgi:hypothetical protein
MLQGGCSGSGCGGSEVRWRSMEVKDGMTEDEEDEEWEVEVIK